MSADKTSMPAFGPTRLDDGRVRFTLWAPDAAQIALVVDGADIVPMQRSVDGWFTCDVHAADGARYRFRLDDGTLVPDPASRYQPDGVDGASELHTQSRFDWRHEQWRGRPWHEIVLYEAHVGLFGGYDGLRAALPRLAELGITALELMPLAQAPGTRNWGYDGVFPFSPAAEYGTPDELRALVDAAHGLGIAVFLDVVYNHFGPEGNHLARYAGGFFTTERETPWGAAIDFDAAPVRDFFEQNAVMWLQDYRFDGLRLDAVHAIAPREWLLALQQRVEDGIDAGRHVHLVLENDDNEAHLLEAGYSAQWNDDIHHVLHTLLTGEKEGYYAAYVDAPATRLARALREGFVYQGESFAPRDGRSRGTPSAHLSPLRFVAFVQNHDQIGNRAHGERIASLARPELLPLAYAVLLLSPQIPLLFMGEEDAATTPFLYFADYDGELADAVRDGRCREFAHFRAFADAESRESIPDPNALETWQRSHLPSARDGQAQAQFARLKALLALRRTELAPWLPQAVAIDAEAEGDRALSARWRLGPERMLRIDVNFGDDAVAAPIPVETFARVIHAEPATAAASARKGELPPRSVVVSIAPPP